MPAGMFRVLLVSSTRSPQWKLAPQTTFRKYYSKPPKGKVGPFETIIGLSVFSLGILTPAGWILVHLPEPPKH